MLLLDLCNHEQLSLWPTFTLQLESSNFTLSLQLYPESSHFTLSPPILPGIPLFYTDFHLHIFLTLKFSKNKNLNKKTSHWICTLGNDISKNSRMYRWSYFYNFKTVINIIYVREWQTFQIVLLECIIQTCYSDKYFDITMTVTRSTAGIILGSFGAIF